MKYDTRLDRLERRRRVRNPHTCEVRVAAEQAFADAVRAQLARRLAGEPDTPEQVAAYAAVYAQWQAVQGRRVEDPSVRDRIAARLEAMAARIEASAARDLVDMLSPMGDKTTLEERHG